MNVLAIIPARGQSKRLPRKNLREVGGRSLIEWSVRAAARSRLVTGMLLSSEDHDILAHGTDLMRRYSWDKWGGVTERPPGLATDTATTDSVLLASLTKDAEVVVLLQPTVPFRAPWLVDHCIERLLAWGPGEVRRDAVFTAREDRLGAHFGWMRHGGQGWACTAPRRPMRQDMTINEWEALENATLFEDGSVFVCRAETLRATGSRLGGFVEPVVMDPRDYCPDIDTEEDLAEAERLYQRHWRAAEDEERIMRGDPLARPPQGVLMAKGGR